MYALFKILNLKLKCDVMENPVEELYREDGKITRRQFLKYLAGGAGSIAVFGTKAIFGSRNDGVGRIFEIDGKPDASYKLDTPANAAYAFVDLIKSGDCKKLREVMGGEYGALDVHAQPLSDVEFNRLVNKKRSFYSGTNKIRIDKIEYSPYRDRSDVYLTMNGNSKHKLLLIKRDDNWYVGAYNLVMARK